MYQYTEMWENWINIFRKLRITRESVGKDLWINQTSYCNASPWFLQWSDTLWIQNSGDIGFIDKTKKGEKLSDRDVDRVLTYRDNCYHDFSVVRNYQFPHEFIYNHDPIYGNTAKISMTDEEFRKYMLMMATRGTAFWELYYSYNMFNTAKWRINADALRFIRNNYETLKTSQFIGGSPEKGEAYGYSCWSENSGVISLRNPANRQQSITITLDETIGVNKGMQNLKMAYVYPYDKKTDGKTYSYGEVITVNLMPLEVLIMKFSQVEEKLPQLIYSRFESDRELLLFFNDRIYVDENAISSDAKISSIQLLEDYSTLKINFAEPTDKAFVSLTVKNAFGDMADAQINVKYHKDFICEDMKVPCGRDFTVQCTVNNAEDGVLFSIGDIVNVSNHEGCGAIRFDSKTSRGDISLHENDKLTVICEPNGLIKLYINNSLACSVYNGEEYCTALEDAEITITDKVNNLKVMSKALDFNKM